MSWQTDHGVLTHLFVSVSIHVHPLAKTDLACEDGLEDAGLSLVYFLLIPVQFHFKVGT